MIPAIQLKWSMAGAHIVSVVISKLGYWQEPYPIILFEVNKDPEIHFHPIILAFRLESGGKSPLNAKKVAKQ